MENTPALQPDTKIEALELELSPASLSDQQILAFWQVTYHLCPEMSRTQTLDSSYYTH